MVNKCVNVELSAGLRRGRGRCEMYRPALPRAMPGDNTIPVLQCIALLSTKMVHAFLVFYKFCGVVYSLRVEPIFGGSCFSIYLEYEVNLNFSFSYRSAFIMNKTVKVHI